MPILLHLGSDWSRWSCDPALTTELRGAVFRGNPGKILPAGEWEAHARAAGLRGWWRCRCEEAKPDIGHLRLAWDRGEQEEVDPAGQTRSTAADSGREVRALRWNPATYLF